MVDKQALDQYHQLHAHHGRHHMPTQQHHYLNDNYEHHQHLFLTKNKGQQKQSTHRQNPTARGSTQQLGAPTTTTADPPATGIPTGRTTEQPTQTFTTLYTSTNHDYYKPPSHPISALFDIYDNNTATPKDAHWDGSPDLTDPKHNHQTAYRSYLASNQQKIEMKGVTDPDWSDAETSADEGLQKSNNRSMTRQEQKQMDREIPWREIMNMSHIPTWPRTRL